jgi:hypothetical protein
MRLIFLAYVWRLESVCTSLSADGLYEFLLLSGDGTAEHEKSLLKQCQFKKVFILWKLGKSGSSSRKSYLTAVTYETWFNEKWHLIYLRQKDISENR